MCTECMRENCDFASIWSVKTTVNGMEAPRTIEHRRVHQKYLTLVHHIHFFVLLEFEIQIHSAIRLLRLCMRANRQRGQLPRDEVRRHSSRVRGARAIVVVLQFALQTR